MKALFVSACHILVAVILLSTLTTPVCPQNIPNAGSLLQEQQRTQPPALQPLAPPSAEKEMPSLKETGAKFVVKGFKFSGAEGLATDKELNDLLKDSIGKEMGITGLKRLADRVSKYLKKKGWFLARAYIPEQEIKDGIVEIAIIGGKLEGKVDIRGENLRISRERLQNMVTSQTREGEALNQQDIVRSLLLMNDLPGIQARSTLEPGETSGTTKLVIDAAEGPLLGGRVWGDNYGSRYTGTYRGSGLFQVNDPFRYGDQLFLNATDNPLYQYGQAGYSFPVGYTGLRAGLLYSEMRYRIDRDVIALDADGGARIFGVTLSYPIQRSRTSNLWIGAEFDRKNLWDNTSGAALDDKAANAGTFRLYGDRLDTVLGGGYSTVSAGFTGGSLDRSAVLDDLILDQRTAQSNGTYGKFNYGVSRLQMLYGDLTLFATVYGQFTFNNLDSSEQFILGGPNGVRAYPIGEAIGDSGGIATAELRYDFPELWKLGVPQLIGFYDFGWISLHQTAWDNSGTPVGNRNNYSISGGGMGVNLTKSGLYAIRFAWAAKAGTNPGRSLTGKDADDKSDDNRYWLQAMVYF